MLECFLLREFREFFKKRQVVDSCVVHADRAFASRTFQLRILSRPMNVPEGTAAQMPFPFRWEPRANWDPIETCLEIDFLIIPDAGIRLGMNAFAATRI